MPLIAEAEIETDQAGRQLTHFFEHLAERARAHPDLGVRLEWSDTNGTAEFAWGRCAMEAKPNLLTLRADAGDQEGLEEIKEFVTRHLERHSDAEQLRIDWRQPGRSAVDPHDPDKRRGVMRRFHRRVRH